MEKLAQYLEHNSPGALAARAGISRQYLWRLEKGGSLPRVDIAVRIARATDGAVPVDAWYQEETPDAKRADQDRAAS